MTAYAEVPTVGAGEGAVGRWGTAVCIAGAIGALAAVPLMGAPAGNDGQGVTDTLVASAARMQLVSVVAMVAAAALILAAVRVGRRMGGTPGAVATIAGAAVAVLLGAYYSAYAAAAVVGSYVLEEVGGGLGESSLVALNVVELTRYAPGLALVVAAIVARKTLGRPLTVAAGALLVLMLLPFTTWLAAVLTPVWLGAAGALSGRPVKR